MNKIDRHNLSMRYLIWFYKITKEALDKIDRKFTQLEVDRIVYKKLESSLKNSLKNPRLNKLLKEFEAYIARKGKDATILKFGRVDSKVPTLEYTFLKAKLDSIEFATKKLFGANGLKRIKQLYQKEMTQRIMQSTEH